MNPVTTTVTPVLTLSLCFTFILVFQSANWRSNGHREKTTSNWCVLGDWLGQPPWSRNLVHTADRVLLSRVDRGPKRVPPEYPRRHSLRSTSYTFQYTRRALLTFRRCFVHNWEFNNLFWTSPKIDVRKSLEAGSGNWANTDILVNFRGGFDPDKGYPLWKITLMSGPSRGLEDVIVVYCM